MNKKSKHSIHDLVREVSPHELVIERRQNELRRELGINYNWEDKMYDKYVKSFLNISTHYKSIKDYELDKVKASLLIDEGKEIPQDLYNRLVQTKQELDKAGLNINR